MPCSITSMISICNTHEQSNLGTTVHGRSYARGKLHRLYTDFTKLSKPHQLLLPQFPAHIKECIKAVEVNSRFLSSIVENAVGFFQNSDVSEFVSASSINYSLFMID